MKGFKKITKIHDNILDEIEIALRNVEKDIDKQQDNFYTDPNYKLYSGVRNDKGYTKWKYEVIDRFKNQCCVCYSTENLVAHHLFSYKYYPELRTEINNGVCICNPCHEIFNKENSNVNTLEQFIQYRTTFLGWSHEEVKSGIEFKRQFLQKHIRPVQVKKNEYKTPEIGLSKEEQLIQDEIVSSFEQLKQELANEAQLFEKTYGNQKGIRVIFRNKETTSLSAISKLRSEVMRLNTLISCNKMKDKTLMASKFHVPYDEFCKKLQDPKEYNNFTPSEITHLNKILFEDYKEEYLTERE